MKKVLLSVEHRADDMEDQMRAFYRNIKMEDLPRRNIPCYVVAFRFWTEDMDAEFSIEVVGVTLAEAIFRMGEIMAWEESGVSFTEYLRAHNGVRKWSEKVSGQRLVARGHT